MIHIEQLLPEQLRAVLQRKSILFVGLSVGYLLLIGLLKWNISPPVWAAGYLVGGLLGIYFLDVAEVFFKLSPSPFRSQVAREKN